MLDYADAWATKWKWVAQTGRIAAVSSLSWETTPYSAGKNNNIDIQQHTCDTKLPLLKNWIENSSTKIKVSNQQDKATPPSLRKLSVIDWLIH